MVRFYKMGLPIFLGSEIRIGTSDTVVSDFDGGFSCRNSLSQMKRTMSNRSPNRALDASCIMGKCISVMDSEPLAAGTENASLDKFRKVMVRCVIFRLPMVILTQRRSTLNIS